MNIKCITRPKINLSFPLCILIGCCFSIQQSYAGSNTKRGITIDDLVTIRDIQTMALSPDGKYVAFQTMQRHIDTNDFTVEWYIAATKPGATGKQPIQDDIVGQFLPSEIIWTPDSKWIYFTKKQGDSIQIWRSSLKSPKAQQVTHNPGDVQSQQMSPDGSKVFFTIGRTHAEIEAIKRDGARQGYLQQNPPLYYFTHGAIIPPCSYDQRHFDMGMGSEKLACSMTHWVYDIKSGIERKATEVEINAITDQDDDLNKSIHQGFQLNATMKLMKKHSPDGTQLAWIENENPEIYKGLHPSMILAASMDNKVIRCSAPQGNSQNGVGFRGVWWHPNGKEIIFQVI